MTHSTNSILSILIFVLSTSGLLAQPTFVDAPIYVNPTTSSTNIAHEIAADNYGNYVVVWNSDDAGDSDAEEIYGRLFNANGTARTATFQINSFVYNRQIAPKVAMNPAGEFVVVWTSLEQDGLAWGIFGQRFDNQGNPVGTEFQINNIVESAQLNPEVAMDAAGNFVVVWHTERGNTPDAKARLFTADGLARGDEFLVTTMSGAQNAKKVSMDVAGNFTILWENKSTIHAVEGQLFYQSYTADGTPMGSEVAVMDDPVWMQDLAIDRNRTGDFVISWSEYTGTPATNTTNEMNYYAKYYRKDGTLIRDKFQINQHLLNLSFGRVKLMNNGNIFFSYYSFSNQRDIYARYYDNTGQPIGNEFSCIQNTDNQQEVFSAIAATNDRILLAYNRSYSEIYVQQFTNVNSRNTSCDLALSLSLNPVACGNLTQIIELTDEVATSSPPSTDCNTAYNNQEVWTQVIVPATGNFLLRNLTNTLDLNIEAYVGNPGDLMAFTCADLSELPHAIVVDQQPPGTTIYFRIWEQNGATGEIELSAHELSADPAAWELCDIAISANNTTGGGNKIALEFLVQYAEDATNQEITSIQQDLNNAGATVKKECSCKNGQPLQLWETTDPIATESNIRTSRMKSKVDTSNYNYLIEDRTIRANTEVAGQQEDADVAVAADGSFVITWVDNGIDGDRKGIAAQRFSAQGLPQGDVFAVNTYTTGQQERPIIGMKGDGRFVIGWRSYNQEVTNGFSGHAQVFAADGSKIGGEISVNFGTGIYIQDILLREDNNHFLIVFFGNDNNGNATTFYQRYNGSGVPQMDVQQVNFAPPIFGLYPSAAMNTATNDYFIAFGGEGNVYYNAYQWNNNHTKFLDEVQANTFKSGSKQWITKTAANSLGEVVITWQVSNNSTLGDLDYGIAGQKFDAQGQKIGTTFLANTYTDGEQRWQDVAMFADGSFLVVWQSVDQDGSGLGIYGQLFDKNAQKIGNEFQINQYTDNDQALPAIAANESGQGVIVWESYGQDRNGSGVFIQRFNVNTTGATPIINLEANNDAGAGLGVPLTYSTSVYTPSNPPTNAEEAAAVLKVAVIDTGVEEDHPRLVNAQWEGDGNGCLPLAENGFDFVDNDGIPNDTDGHGTGVNGMILRDFPNDLNVELINLKYYENTRGDLFDAVCGIYQAVNAGAKVINLSWGFEAIEFPTILNDALIYAAENDVLITTSAGNTSKNNDAINKYPANLNIPTLITVGAYQRNSNNGTPLYSAYSSFGTMEVDIAASGYVETTDLHGQLNLTSGTSLAAPTVAHTAAVIRATYPVLTALEVRDCILNTAESVTDFAEKVATGGILDHAAALACAANKATIDCATEGLNIISLAVDESCAGSDGAIQITLTGTTRNAVYTWAHGATEDALSQLTVGSYHLTVTDGYGCSDEAQINIGLDCGGSENCSDETVLNQDDIPTNIYRSNTTIESAGQIKMGSDVEYIAVQSITLNAGFIVESGATFTARIGESCMNLQTSEVVEREIEPTNKFADLNLKLSPNPTDNQVFIKMDAPLVNNGRLQLLDWKGQLLTTHSVGIGQQYFNLKIADLAAGVYIVQLQTSSRTWSEKLVKI